MKRPQFILAVVGLAAAGFAAWYVQRPATQGPVVTASSPADGGVAKGPGAPAGPGTGSAPGLGAEGKAPGGKAGGPGGPPGGGSGAPGGGGPVAVEVGKAELTRLEDDAQAVGTLRARRSVVLRPEVSGRIATLGFADGQRVKKGQLLLQLDDTLQAAQLKQAEAQAGIARTNLQRSRELAAQNFVSQSAVDQNAAALDVALAQVALAQAQMSRMRVMAPFDAATGIRSLSVGDYVKDGADVVTLDDIGTVYLDFRLPERHVPQIKPGRTVEAQFDALPGRRFSGVVTALDSQVDANGRALLVRAELKNADGALRPGMFARARVVFGVREKAILVPEEALVPLAGKQFVYKVVQGPKGPVSQRIEAQVGMRLAGKVEILKDLAPGDTVVTAGHARLVRGDALPLRVVDIDKPGGGPGRPPGAPGAGGKGDAAKADGAKAGGGTGESPKGEDGKAAGAGSARAASRPAP